jgi:hypothetical protein
VTERFLWTGRGDLRGSGRIDIAQGAHFDIEDARESKELDGWEIHNAGTGL